MKETLYTLKIKNGPSGGIKDLLTDYGFVCLSGANYPATDRYKALEKTSWYDEDGDDVYHPARRYKESFNLEIPIGCEGNRDSGGVNVKTKFNTLESFLCGTLQALSPEGISVYMPMEQIGYNGCDLVEIKDKDYQKQGTYEIFTCTLVLTVSDPTDVWDGA